MVFDLDPSSEDFEQVKATAESFYRLLEVVELPAYVKTTGSRGLHVAVPLNRGEDFDSVREFARRLAEIVVTEDPSHRTLEQYKVKRKGRVFVDTNRNAYVQTIAPAFAVRARPHAPVSATLDWIELSKKRLRPDRSRPVDPPALARYRHPDAALGPYREHGGKQLVRRSHECAMTQEPESLEIKMMAELVP
jgi:bifunctional non-homologous end joining protein LigD